MLHTDKPHSVPQTWYVMVALCGMDPRHQITLHITLIVAFAVCGQHHDLLLTHALNSFWASAHYMGNRRLVEVAFAIPLQHPAELG